MWWDSIPNDSPDAMTTLRTDRTGARLKGREGQIEQPAPTTARRDDDCAASRRRAGQRRWSASESLRGIRGSFAGNRVGWGQGKHGRRPRSRSPAGPRPVARSWGRGRAPPAPRRAGRGCRATGTRGWASSSALTGSSVQVGLDRFRLLWGVGSGVGGREGEGGPCPGFRSTRARAGGLPLPSPSRFGGSRSHAGCRVRP